jgi:hypothetical protein
MDVAVTLQKELADGTNDPLDTSCGKAHGYLRVGQLMRSRQAALQQDAQLQSALPNLPLPRHCRTLSCAAHVTTLAVMKNHHPGSRQRPGYATHSTCITRSPERPFKPFYAEFM